MPDTFQTTYKNEYQRYRHYYHRLWVFYQKPTIKVTFALLLTIFTIIFFAVFAIRPTLITVTELIKRIQDRQEVLSKLEQKAAQLSAAQQEYLKSQAKLEFLNQALPPEPDAQTLIRLIEATAAYHSVSLTGFSLGEIVYSQTEARPPEEVGTLPLTLTVTADFPSLYAFSQSLSQLIRELRLTSFTISPDKETDEPGANLLTASYAGEALYYPPKP